ncbi:MAG: hypothetical protein ACNI3H_04020 [Halarcobacter ebronensis]|uniref:hypothetical protein n=1 Tax=Halarcobacter ebronensis TaxID=1462615 RepID=UPI003C73DF69
MKNKIIDCISELIYQTTSNQQAFDNRLKGFIAEALAPDEVVRANGHIPLKGGWIIPLPSSPRFRDTIKVLYLTILDPVEFRDNESKYCEIYNKLEKFEYKFLATYALNWDKEMDLDDKFSKMKFPEIDITYYKFHSEEKSFVESNYDSIQSLQKRTPPTWKKPKTFNINRTSNQILNKLSDNSLSDILCERYIFDYKLGNMFFGRGVPADFDLIVYFPKYDKYVIYEIKEKDKSKKNNNKNNVVGFGMDIDRIDDYATFIEWFPSFDFRYLVREINDQTKRDFIAWHSIKMSDFIQKSIFDPEGKSGGQGMLPSTVCPEHIKTAICSFESFKKI